MSVFHHQDGGLVLYMHMCRYRITPGYELLPAARVKAAGMDPRSLPAAVDIMDKEFPPAIATCEAALSEYKGPSPCTCNLTLL